MQFATGPTAATLTTDRHSGPTWEAGFFLPCLSIAENNSVRLCFIETLYWCLCRFAAAENHEVVRIVLDSRPKLLRPTGLTPSLQHPVHVQVREQGADHTTLWSATIIVLTAR